MRPLLSLASLLACKADPTPTDKATPPGDTATPTGDTAASTGDTAAPTPPTWTGQRACGSIRLFAAAGDRGLAIELDADVWTAIIDQTLLEIDADFALGDAYGIVQDGIVEGDVCGSIEEFPPYPGPHWKIAGGTLHLEFTPASGLSPDDTDWSYDGTELGTVEVELRDLVLTPMQGEKAAEIPDFDFVLPLAYLDLPA